MAIKKAKSNTKKPAFILIITFLIAIILLLSIFFKPIKLKSRELYSIDESLYNKIAAQLAVNIFDYNSFSYYEYIKVAKPQKEPPAYLKKPLFKHPPLYCLLLSIPKKLGLNAIAHVNYFSFYISLLLLIAVFFIAKKLYGNRIAFLAFLFLSIEPIYRICSLRLWLECTMVLFIYLALLFFVLGWKKNEYYSLSGLALGLGMLTKYPAALIVPVILIFSAIYKPELFKNIRFYMIFIIASLIFMPWVIWNIAVYGSFLQNLTMHGNSILITKIFSLFKNPGFIILLLFSLFAFCFAASKEYFVKIGQLIKKKNRSVFLIATLLLISLFSIKYMRQAFVESFLLDKVPLVTTLCPSIFAKEPWFFYLGRILQMSPLFILSYLSLYFMGSKLKEDKLLLITVFVTLLFYIGWGNYQSRYILAAIPALMILASRSFFWVWDKLGQVKKGPLSIEFLRSLLICLVGYFALKTLIIGKNLGMAFLGDYYFTYF